MSYTEDFFTERFPFPISFLLARRVLDEHDPQRRVMGIIQTTETTLRYLAMLILAEYSAYPDQDETTDELVDHLSRPSLGHLQAIVEQVPSRLSKLGWNWFISELPNSIRKLRATGGLAAGRGNQSLLQSLVSLRNRCAHQEYSPDWGKMAEQYYPLLLRFLEQIAFLADYPLCRVVGEQVAGEYSVIELTGSTNDFCDRVASLQLPEWCREHSAVLLLDKRFEKSLPLFPYIVMHTCERCREVPELPGLTEEVFLFAGSDGDNMAYIGARHGIELHDVAFSDIRRHKKSAQTLLPVAEVGREVVLQRTVGISRRYIDAETQNGVFLPGAYVARTEIESELEMWLHGDRTGFLMLGESGIGKTTLLCHWVAEMQRSQIPVLYYPASMIDTIDLGKWIMKDLQVSGELFELLAASSAEDCLPLVVVIDAVNEHPRSLQAVQEINDFINRYRDSPLKVLLCLRTSRFRQVLDSLVDTCVDPNGTSFFSPAVYHTSLRKGDQGSRETCQMVLAKLDANGPELEEMYERYRSLEPGGVLGVGEPSFCPVTPFFELSRQMRELIANPWYLRLVVETYHGREVPARMLSLDLVQEYCQRTIHDDPGAAGLVEDLVGLMIRRATAFLMRRELRTDDYLRSQMEDTSYAISPYSRLINKGVLVEMPELRSYGVFRTTQYRVQFAFDRVFEFLMANHIMAHNSVTGNLVVEIVRASRNFAPFSGVVQNILCHVARQDGGKLLDEVIVTCDDATPVEPLISALRMLQTCDCEAYDHVLGCMQQRSSPRDAMMLLGLGNGMALENGWHAQNQVHELLHHWNDGNAVGWKLLAGGMLIHGYEQTAEYTRMVELYNEIQPIYAQETGAPLNLMHVDRGPTQAQVERMRSLAWACESLGSQLVFAALLPGITYAPLDDMFRNLGLDSLSRFTMHSVNELLAGIAVERILESSEAAAQAGERMFELTKQGNPNAALRAFDQVGLDLRGMTAEMLPAIRAEVEGELRAVCQPYMSVPDPNERRTICEGVVRMYVHNRLEPGASLEGRYNQWLDLVELNQRLAQYYDNLGDTRACYDLLMKAKDYAEAVMLSPILLNLYEQILRTASRLDADQQSRQPDADRWLAVASYLAIPEQERSALLQLEPEVLFHEVVGVMPDNLLETPMWRLRIRCLPWVSGHDLDSADRFWKQCPPYDGWAAYMQERVPQFEILRREEIVLRALQFAVIKETLLNPDDLPPLIDERVQIASRDIARALSGNDTGVAPIGGYHIDIESETRAILNDIRGQWGVFSTADRLFSAAAAAAYPAFNKLLLIDEDPGFCEAIGKEPGCRQTTTWIRSVIKCWCADLAKGRVGTDDMRVALDSVSTREVLMAQYPQHLLMEIGARLFAHRLQQHMSQDAAANLVSMSSSADNLEALVAEMREQIGLTGISADQSVSDLQAELMKEHQSLMAEWN